MSGELQILLLILGALLLGYYMIMPRLAGRSLKRSFIVDLVLMGFVLVGAGSKFSGLGMAFSLILFDTNWFIFTLLSYCALETPFALWYMRKNDIHFD